MEDLFIKAATVIAVGLATFSSFPSTAQQDAGTQKQSLSVQQTSQNMNSQSSIPNSHKARPNSVAEALKPVSGELVDKPAAKSASKGNSVMVKTDQNVTISSETKIPKGSMPTGHVTDVQPR